MTEPSLDPLEVINPLRVIGLIHHDTSLTEDEKLCRIRPINKGMYRLLARILHTDVGGSQELMAEIASAFEMLENDELLPIILDHFFDSAEARRFRSDEKLRRQLSAQQQHIDRLLPFLAVADWRAVLGSAAPQELLFGLPSDTVNILYYQTFGLQCGQDVRPALFELQHPIDNADAVPFRVTPVWERRRWVVRQTGFTGTSNDQDDPLEATDMPDEIEVTYTYVRQHKLGPVTLVGGIPAAQLHHMVDQYGSSLSAHSSLAVGGRSASLVDLTWEEPQSAWWKLGLVPQLKPGDYGVIARGMGDKLRLALIGRLMTSRLLK